MIGPLDTEGLEVGKSVGKLEGLKVDCIVGLVDGVSVGFIVGLVGVIEGAAVGLELYAQHTVLAGVKDGQLLVG